MEARPLGQLSLPGLPVLGGLSCDTEWLARPLSLAAGRKVWV